VPCSFSYRHNVNLPKRLAPDKPTSQRSSSKMTRKGLTVVHDVGKGHTKAHHITRNEGRNLTTSTPKSRARSTVMLRLPVSHSGKAQPTTKRASAQAKNITRVPLFSSATAHHEPRQSFVLSTALAREKKTKTRRRKDEVGKVPAVGSLHDLYPAYYAANGHSSSETRSGGGAPVARLPAMYSRPAYPNTTIRRV